MNADKLDHDNFGYVLDNDNRYVWPYAPEALVLETGSTDKRAGLDIQEQSHTFIDHKSIFWQN